jgi:hypothetical protein
MAFIKRATTVPSAARAFTIPDGSPPEAGLPPASAGPVLRRTLSNAVGDVVEEIEILRKTWTIV